MSHPAKSCFLILISMFVHILESEQLAILFMEKTWKMDKNMLVDFSGVQILCVKLMWKILQKNQEKQQKFVKTSRLKYMKTYLIITCVMHFYFQQYYIYLFTEVKCTYNTKITSVHNYNLSTTLWISILCT